jgi:pimeloyl-ACP methyl ester carboxylesterase
MIRAVTFNGCFGWLHEAEGADGVVICPPWGYEALCTHRALRALAMRLAASGHPTLRFDPPGTGDSLGADTDLDRVGAWLRGINTAVDELHHRAGVSRVTIIGLRLGALLAAQAASERGGVERLVLLAAPVTGAAHVRELQAFARLSGEASEPAGTDASDAQSLTGFIMTADTRRALSGLDLRRLPAASVRHLLLMPRGEASQSELRLASELRLGSDITTRPLAGYTALMQDALTSKVPYEDFRAIAEWIGPATSRPPRYLAPQAAAMLAGDDFVERSITIMGTARLSGIFCEPSKSPAQRLLVVLLNTGANRRIGYGRIWVSFARHLARLGYPSLRLDIAGIGDSEDRTEGGCLEHNDASPRDVRAALDWAEASGYPRTASVGVCSGAHLAFQSVLADSRPALQFLVNLDHFHCQEDAVVPAPAQRRNVRSTSAYLDRLGTLSTWCRLIKGEVDITTVGCGLYHRYSGRVSARARALLSPNSDPGRRVRQDLRRLAERGVKTVIAYGAEDPGLDEFTRNHGHGGRRLRRIPRTRCAILPEIDHNISTETARAWLFRLLEQALDNTLQMMKRAPMRPAISLDRRVNTHQPGLLARNTPNA